MANWQIVFNDSGVLQPADVTFKNVLGTPILSVSRIADRAEGSQTPNAGIFIVTAISASTVFVTAKGSSDLKSPNLSVGNITVTTDGLTANTNVIPGLSIVFYPMIAGDYAEIGIGCYWDSTTYWWNRITSLGLGVGGTEGSNVVVTVENDTGYDQSNSRVIVTNAARIANTEAISQPIFAFRQTGLLNPTADTDAMGKSITFATLVEGTPNTVDILVDGSSIAVYDVTNSTLIADGTGLLCDETTVYRFADATAYQSCEFVLSSDLTESDTATIYVSDGGDFVELYESSTNEFVSGITGVYLTAYNCGLGVVPAGLSADFTMRLSPPIGRTVDLNQRQFSIRIYSEGI